MKKRTHSDTERRSARKGPMLAKLTPPTLQKIIPRPRLLRELDRARKRPIVWITAPPGAGKTTLVASYLKARKLPTLWYQIDEGDADPATFFYYLREAGQQFGQRRHQPLPLLTPEYRPGLAIFTKRFLESLCARLCRPAAIVFDNFQLFSMESDLLRVLVAAFEVIPPDVTLFVLSRQPTPPMVASLQAQQRVAFVTDEEMRLTEAEAMAVARLHQSRSNMVGGAELLRQWYHYTRGWMAGMILLAESKQSSAQDLSPSDGHLPQVLFDYLATEVFHRFEPATQQVLRTTAFASTVTGDMATTLSGVPDAVRRLNQLAQAGYFTEQRRESIPIYQYHPLFRQFLKGQVADQAEAMALRQQTARLLEQAGRADEAIDLHLQAGNWSGVLPVLLAHAPTLMREGRVESLARWIQTLPPAMREQTPWLQFWLGSCLCALDPQGAPQLLEQTATQFEQAGDLTGQLLTLALLIEITTYAGQDWRPIQTWAETILRLTQQGTEFPSADVECRVTLALTNAMVIVGWGTEAETWCWRSLRLLQTSHGKEAISHVGHTLMLWMLFTGRQREANALLAELDRARQSSQDNSLSEIRYLSSFCLWAWRAGQFVEACDAAERGLILGETTGLHHFTTPLEVFGSYAALAMHDRDRWDGFAKRLPDLLKICPSVLIQSHAIRLQAGFALLNGDISQAKLLLTQNQSYFRGTGYDDIFQMLWVPPLLHLHYRAGWDTEVEAELMALVTWRQHPLAGLDSWHHSLLLTCIHQAQGHREKSLQTLREGLRIGRECQFFVTDWPMHEEMAECCAMALEEGIEVDYACELIRRMNLAPPEQAQSSTAWPWAIRVQTLGRFVIIVDDRPLQFGRKIPRMPLMLLQAIIAHGGQNVATTTLCDLLWPEADGDAAYRSLKMALSRLRTILKHSDAIILKDAHLSLNPRYCWVDALAFEQVAKDTLILLGQGRLAKGTAQAMHASTLYGGEFLPLAAEIPWIHPCRDRLTSLAARLKQASPNDAL
jgi:LuxR family transcriptional regulator, maltose regulon positive regulatory protein